MSKALIICGATATGKSALAVACAKQLKSGVISADSQLVYKDLNLGTAKPTVEEMEGVSHYMIDIVSPDQNYSVSDYESSALPLVKGFFARNQVPVICGGTGFYINSLLFDLSYGNVEANIEIREKYEKILNEEGKDVLYSILESKDKETSLKLHKNDTKRIIRALEIFEVSGKKKSEQHDEYKPRFPYVAVAIDYPRDELYNRINRRVEVMFRNGLLNEVQTLLKNGIDENCQSMQAIGYKEVLLGLRNGWSEDEMIALIQQNTRRYAKRQQTFFKKLPGIIWVTPKDATVDKIMEFLK